jgi:rubrerythrin
MRGLVPWPEESGIPGLKYNTGGGHLIKDLTLKGCIEFAVATEDVGAKFYRQLAKKFTGHRELPELFELLGKDEEEHKRQFSELLRRLPKEPAASGTAGRSDYVRAMSVSEFFSRDRGPFADIDKIGDRDDALDKVFGFEKATLGFYQAVRDMIGSNAVLNQVIEAEKNHITRVMKIMITGARFRGIEDQWP